MNEYQLKLAKLYAELLGLTYVEYKGLILVSHGSSCDKPFNPFIGQLQLDARDNFEVEVNYVMAKHAAIYCVNAGGLVNIESINFKSKEEIPLAVIE